MVDVIYSICILCMNHLKITKKCLESLIKNTEFDGYVELIIVDNGSSKEMVNWLINFQHSNMSSELGIVLIFNNENRGCTGGRNQAIELARGKYVVILDNDVEITQSDWLIKLKEFYCTNENVGIVGPKMLFAENPQVIQQIGFGVTERGNIGYIGRGEYNTPTKYSEPRELQGYPAACWFTERELFRKFGAFDDIFYPVNYEDADFCYRIREQGYRIMYCPFVEMYHHEHVTTRHSDRLQINKITLHNGIIFKQRWHHMYSVENGMAQSEIYWGNVEKTDGK